MWISPTRLLASLLVCAPLAGCAQDPEASQADGQVATAESALSASVTPVAVSSQFTTVPSLPAGVAGGADVVFIGSPLEGRVIAHDRHTGAEIGDLPAPPGGFALAYIMHSIGPDRIAVLDAGGLPQPKPFVPDNPTIYEYTYSYDAHGAFSASLARTVSFASVPVGFAEDIAPLGNGRYLLSDTIFGTIWVVESDGSIRPGVGAASSAPSDAIPELAFCDNMPVVQVGGLPFLFSGSTFPGVGTLATRNGELYFYSTCKGSVYKMPLASLFDSRTPSARAADIRPLSAKPSNVVVEELLAFAFNPFAPNEPYLYAADALQLRVIRIDTRTGAREVVGDDPTLFNFPSSTAFVPTKNGRGELIVVSNEQQRTPLTNDAITQDVLETPFVVAKVNILPKDHDDKCDEDKKGKK